MLLHFVNLFIVLLNRKQLCCQLVAGLPFSVRKARSPRRRVPGEAAASSCGCWCDSSLCLRCRVLLGAMTSQGNCILQISKFFIDLFLCSTNTQNIKIVFLRGVL